jgi:hypothetical protein
MRRVARKAVGTSKKRLGSTMPVPALEHQLEGCIGNDVRSIVPVTDEVSS